MSDEVEVTVSWNPNIGAIVDSAIAFGLNNAGMHLQAKMKTNFGTTPGPRGSVRTGLEYRYRWNPKTNGWKRSDGKTRRRHGLRKARYPVSVPGGFPGIQTGRLRQSIGIIRATRSNLVVTVGTDLKYGRHLEYGTRKMAARPWCRRTFNEERAKMVAMLAADAGKAITAQLGGK